MMLNNVSILVMLLLIKISIFFGKETKNYPQITFTQNAIYKVKRLEGVDFCVFKRARSWRTQRTWYNQIGLIAVAVPRNSEDPALKMEQYIF